jgi:telomere length regulation protein
MFLDNLGPQSSSIDTLVSEAAGLLNSVVYGDESRKKVLVDWCTASSGAGLGYQTAIRRAVLSVLAQDKELIINVFENSLAQFGDELYIKHAAILQQDGECHRYSLRFFFLTADSRPKFTPKCCS